MSTPATPTATRRVPPPCWTHDETLALINAYSTRWLSLNRGNLRTSDWVAVSSDVSAANLAAPKSSIQCRHKIEKLRKRYRSEKQRSLAAPGRFVSSWDLFPLLDSMNFASSSTAAFNNRDRDIFDQKIADGDGFRLKTVNDKKSMSKYGKMDDDLNQGLGFNRDLERGFLRNYGKIDFEEDEFGGGIGLKILSDGNLVNLESRAKDYVETIGDLRSNIGFDRDYAVGFGVKMQGDRNFVAHRLKSYRKIDDYNMDGFPVETLGDRILVPPSGFKPKNYSKIDGNFNINSCSDHDADYVAGNGSEYYAKTFHDGDFVPLGSRLKSYGSVDRNLNSSVGFHGVNEYVSSSRMKFGKKNGSGGVKRGLDPFEELVSSITLLTERFLKMEKMKMDMARETQKLRMETERKQNQMMLESQQYILDAFFTGLSENKKKRKVKVKVEVVSPNRMGDGDEV
ncbi:hypothetical protein Pint_15752 [Pistacia integerrima]|uniref:Uncharacterized protein n=1 Tax=Pistacia integerrima TaxID=434235 RepID=A0ACC0ZBE3_9ROSI|nr:hypothetical protein Pint_15752 [Pistacia integerrima]